MNAAMARWFYLLFFVALFESAVIMDQHDKLKEQTQQIHQLQQELNDCRINLGACQGDMRGDPINHHDN